MIGRVFWLALLAALAMVATLAQLDRASRSAPAIAPLVPAPFQGFAAERLSEAAIAAEDGTAALKAATRLVHARPLPAEHLRLLAQAAALRDDQERAIAALEAATTRGWRDPVVQLAAGQSALMQGQYEAATQRLGAMFASNIAPQQRDALMAELVKSPGGRDAFARYLAVPTRGRDAAITMAGRTISPEVLAPILAQADSGEAILPCAPLRVIADRYRTAGNESEAALFWPGDCG